MVRNMCLILLQNNWNDLEIEYDIFLEILLHWTLLVHSGLVTAVLSRYRWNSPYVNNYCGGKKKYNVTATSPFPGQPVASDWSTQSSKGQAPMSPAQHHPEGVSQPQNRGCDMPCWVCTVAPLFSLPHAASSLCPSGTDGTVPNKLGVCSFHLRICCPRTTCTSSSVAYYLTFKQ